MVQVPDERKPLSGLRVIEVGSLIAGPFAGRLLADFGAEVIKVEAPGKLDPLRPGARARSTGTRSGGRCRAAASGSSRSTCADRRGQRLMRELLR
jgi:crotonobetainyl-CoA:carnitine CoA-transferase CaiB-like acyl-CoA transferase